jgi:hypothetical protein
VVIQKEPCNKRVVAKVEELLLGGDVGGGEDGLGVELGYVQQDYNGQGGEELFSVQVECLDA